MSHVVKVVRFSKEVGLVRGDGIDEFSRFRSTRSLGFDQIVILAKAGQTEGPQTTLETGSHELSFAIRKRDSGESENEFAKAVEMDVGEFCV